MQGAAFEALGSVRPCGGAEKIPISWLTECQQFTSQQGWLAPAEKVRSPANSVPSRRKGENRCET